MTFYASRTESFLRTSCPSGESATPVQFTKVYQSEISQVAANTASTTDINYAIDGQSYANLIGVCLDIDCDSCDEIKCGNTIGKLYTNCQKYIKTQLNNTGCDEFIWLPYFGTNGPTCPTCEYTFTKVRTFTKNDCLSGCNGSSVAYTKVYYSSVSYQAAQNSATTDTASFNIEGQANANLIGICVGTDCTPCTVIWQDVVPKDSVCGSVLGNGYTTCSHYKRQFNSCNSYTQWVIDSASTTQCVGCGTGFTSTRTDTFTKNNCPATCTGVPVTYTKTYTSYISQLDANTLAAVDINFVIEGQANANNLSTASGCTGGTCSQCVTEWLNSGTTYCSAGNLVQNQYDSCNPSNTRTITVTANASQCSCVTVSVKFTNTNNVAVNVPYNNCSGGALAPIPANGCVVVNSIGGSWALPSGVTSLENGTCATGTFCNAVQTASYSAQFTRTCDVGCTGTTVTFTQSSTVALGTVCRTSLAQANTDAYNQALAQAQNLVNAGGQAFANTNGACNCGGGSCCPQTGDLTESVVNCPQSTYSVTVNVTNNGSGICTTGVEYGWSATNSIATVVNWQTSQTFTVNVDNTERFFFIRKTNCTGFLAGSSSRFCQPVVPQYKYYFEGYTNGSLSANGGTASLASGVSFGVSAQNYNLSIGATNYTASGNITASSGFILEKVERYNYAGVLVATDNGGYGSTSYNTPTNSTYFMISQGVNTGDFETLKVYWITNPNSGCVSISSVTIN